MDFDVSMGFGEEASTNVSAELKALTEKALDANKAHQYALTKYAERLTAELQEMEGLMVRRFSINTRLISSAAYLQSAVTTSDVDEEPDVEIQIPGAKKAMGPCSISEFLNPVRPSQYRPGSFLFNNKGIAFLRTCRSPVAVSELYG